MPSCDGLEEIRATRFASDDRSREEHTRCAGTSHDVRSARHRRAGRCTAFARVAAELLIARTLGLAHLVLRHALIVEMTITFRVRMDPVAFAHT